MMELASTHLKVTRRIMFKDMKAKNDTRNCNEESSWNSGPERYNNVLKTQWIGSLAN